MSKDTNITQLQIEELGNEIKARFEEIGNDVKTQLLQDFDKVLTNDLEQLKSLMLSTTRQQNDLIAKSLQSQLDKVIKQKFGGSVFGQVLADAIVPALFQTGQNLVFNSPNLRSTSGQSLLDLGKSILRSQRRNG